MGEELPKNLKSEVRKMKLKRVARHIPAVLGMIGWIAAGIYARKANRYEPGSILIVDPKMLDEVMFEGRTLTYWIDDDGNRHFETINEDGT